MALAHLPASAPALERAQLLMQLAQQLYVTARLSDAASAMRSAIAAGDAKRFQAVPGIGKRTAERIIVELREKVAGESETDGDGAPAAIGDEDPRAMAREGLLNLGYTPPEAERLLSEAEGESPEEIVQSALRRAAGAKAA